MVGLALALGSAVWLLRHQPGASSPMAPSVESARNTGLMSPGRVSTIRREAGTGNTHLSPAGEPGSMPAAVAMTPLVPGRISLVVNGNGSAGFAERVNAVHAIGPDLTTEENDAFYRYLQTPAKDSPDAEGENWLRNEMLDKLVQQAVVTNALSQLFVALYRDTAQDDVLRDYAVQHMAPVYVRVDANEQAGLQAALWQAVGETDTSIAGTALLALCELAQTNPEFDKSRIAEAALKLAGDEQSGELARITAVQMCGRMGVTSAAPVVLQLAQNSGSVPLRIAAIAALGDVGDGETQPFLLQLAGGSDERLKPAAESALKRLQKRLGT